MFFTLKFIQDIRTLESFGKFLLIVKNGPNFGVFTALPVPTNIFSMTPLYTFLDNKYNKKQSAWQNKCLTLMILIDNWLHAPTHINLKMHHFWSIAIPRKWALVEWGELQLWRSWGKLCCISISFGVSREASKISQKFGQYHADVNEITASSAY